MVTLLHLDKTMSTSSKSFSRLNTQSDGEGILYEKYLFGLKRSNKNGSQYWVCTHKRCNASLTTLGSSIVKSFGVKSDGSHDVEHAPKCSIEVHECITSIKQRIENEPTTPIPLLYDEQVKKFRRNYGSAATVPIFNHVKTALYDYRSTFHPPIPKSLSSINVPYQLSRTISDDEFLFCNNPSTSALGFASATSLNILGSNEHWNADGTFRTAPKLFYQSYSIHVWDEYSMKPAVFAALPNKNESTYSTFLDELVSYSQRTGISLAPRSILIDFEMAAFNAFSKTFPTATIKGCQFHFGQNVWRQLKKRGLVRLSKDTEARRQIANLLSLPLLPPNEINTAMSNIIEEISNVHNNFTKLTDYILHTYIDNPRYPISFWNLFDVIGTRPRTNNHVEGYHGQLNSHCQTHPNVWAWIKFIQELDESTIIRFEQEQAQKRSTRPRRATTVMNEKKLVEGKQNYLNGLLHLDDYLKLLRSLSYRSINIYDKADKDDADYEPNSA
jgi:hypothetical protein